MRLAAMLTVKRLAGVRPEVNLREQTSHTPPPSVNKALKPRAVSPEIQNRGISGPIRRYVSTKFFFKKIDSTGQARVDEFMV